MTHKYKVGDLVVPKIGPHKGHPHAVIHVHNSGHVNIQPKNIHPSKNRYRLGAATAHPEDLTPHTVSEVRTEEVEQIDEVKLVNIMSHPEHGKAYIWHKGGEGGYNYEVEHTKSKKKETHKKSHEDVVAGLKKQGYKMHEEVEQENKDVPKENRKNKILKDTIKSAQEKQKTKLNGKTEFEKDPEYRPILTITP